MDHELFLFCVHVSPGARRPRVGGSHDGHLVVRVRSRAVAGAANAEVLISLAAALGVPRAHVGFVRPTRSRDKLVEVIDSAEVRSRHHELLVEH